MRPLRSTFGLVPGAMGRTLSEGRARGQKDSARVGYADESLEGAGFFSGFFDPSSFAGAGPPDSFFC